MAWYRTNEDEQEQEEEDRYENKEDSEQEVQEWIDEEGYYNIILLRPSEDNNEGF